MPRFRITTPTGRTYSINAPEGATLEDAYQYVAENFPDPVHNPVEPSLGQELGSLARAGMEKGKAFLAPLVPGVRMDDEVARGIGYEDAEEADRAQTADFIAGQEQKAAGIRRTSTATDQGRQEIADAKGWKDSAGAIVRNPRVVGGVVSESLGMAAPALGAAAATGGTAIMPLMVGLGSAATEYGATIEGTLSEAGVDISNPSEVRRALGNEELMNRARDRGVKRGLTIGTIDALTAKLAGRLLAGSTGPGSAAARAGGEVGLQAAGGASGEALGSLAAGDDINPADVIMEAVAEIPTGAVEIPGNFREARKVFLGKQRERDREDMVRRAEKLQADSEAEQGGDRWKPRVVKDDYRNLAEQYGATITSLDRTPERNKKVGGTANSQHLTGTAGDFVVPKSRKAAFIADARRRGYEAIDEGDHIHLELPPGVGGRRARRVADVAAGTLTQGAATVENALDEARSSRDLPLEHGHAKDEAKHVDKPVPFAEGPSRAPDVQALTEQRTAALDRANDISLPLTERRAAKSQAQQIATQIEEAKQAPKVNAVTQLANDLLEQVTTGNTAAMPEIDMPRTDRPEAMEPPAPVQQPAPMAPPAPPVAPQQAPEPTPPPVSQPEVAPPFTPPQQPIQEQQELPPVPPGTTAELAHRPTPYTVASEDSTSQNAIAIRDRLNRDPGFMRGLRNNRSERQLSQNEVVEVKLAPKDQKRIDQYAKLLGREIVLFDLKTEGFNALLAFAHDDRHIYLNMRAAHVNGRSPVALVGHEFLHTLRRGPNANPMVEELMEHVKAEINTSSPYVQGMWRDYNAAYGRRGWDEAKMIDAVSEELLADFIGDILNDEKFWAELEADNPTLFRRLLTKFIAYLQGLLDKADRLSAPDAFDDVRELHRKARLMLREHIKNQQRINNRKPTKERAPARDDFVDPDDSPRASLQADFAVGDEEMIKTLEKEIAGMHAAGDYVGAARLAAELSTHSAPPMDVDTPEKKAFVGKSSRAVNQKEDKAQVMFHGTARDITTFRPKQGDAIFLSKDAAFSGTFAGMSQAWIDDHEPGDVTVDGKSMLEQRASNPIGSTEWIAADLLIKTGDIGQAIGLIDKYAYEDANGEVAEFTSSEADDVSSYLFDLRGKPVVKLPQKNKAGMNIMPLVTNVEKPWDYQNSGDIKRLMNELREKHRTPAKLSEAMKEPHRFENWDAVERALKNGSWTLIEDSGGGIPMLLNEMGYDAYHVSEQGIKNLAVMDPRKVKSAFGNTGAFGTRLPTVEEAASVGMTLEDAIQAQKDGDIRFALWGGRGRGGGGQPPRRTLTQAMGSFHAAWANSESLAQLQRWMTDEFRDLREIQKMIAKQHFGGRIPQNMDAHGQENLRHGAYQDARAHAEERFIAPISRILSKAGLSIDGFSDYLWWRHAPERDAYLRNRLDPAIAGTVGPADLAGISPADARANIAALDPATRKAYERAAKFIDGMRKFTLETKLDSGEISQEHFDGVTQQYDKYVPLRGLPDEMQDLIDQGTTGSGRGVSMSSAGTGKRAAGRKSKPENIIEEMVRDMDVALIGQQKQVMLSSLVRLIAAHPDPQLWSVSPVSSERKWVNGVLTIVPTEGATTNQIIIMHKGVPVKIEIRHPHLRKALLNLNTETLPQVLRRVGRLTRFLSAVKTSLSPFFMLVNPVRDVTFATMGVGAEHGMDAVRSVAKYLPHAYTALGRGHQRHPKPGATLLLQQLMQYEREYSSAGGKTGYTYVNDIREQQRKLKGMLDRHAKSPGMASIAKGGLLSKDGMLLVNKAWQHTAHAFEVANDMAENSTRLAVYAAMRDKGMSVHEAAKYAKEVTVNFNRRGSIGKVLNSFFMFFNAAVQGSARMVKLARNPKFMAMMGSLAASSFTITLAQMIAAGDDDDGESLYDKAISDKQAQRTISIHLGGDRSLALPVPYGPNIFSYIGYRMARATYDQMRGRDPSMGKVAGDIASQMIMSMSPIDPGRGPQSLLPEIARIPAMAWANKSDFGGRLNSSLDDRDKNAVHYQDTNVKTNQFYRVMAGALNAASGGDAYTPGAINWSGEQVRYTVEQFTGGMGRLVSESVEMLDNMLMGIDPEPSDVPLVNVYLRGRGNARSQSGPYYDNVDEYERAKSQWGKAVERDDEGKMLEIIEREPWVDGSELDASTTEGRQAQEGSVMQTKRRIDREIKGLRREKDALLRDETISRKERKQMQMEIDEEIAGLQMEFNYALNQARGYPVAGE